MRGLWVCVVRLTLQRLSGREMNALFLLAGFFASAFYLFCVFKEIGGGYPSVGEELINASPLSH